MNLAAIAVTALIAVTPAASAAVSCTNDLLTGVYGLRVSGMIKAPITVGVAGVALSDAMAARMKAGSAGANAAAGYARLVMDGTGGISGSSGASIVGIWSQGPVVGQYTVSEDCTFGLTLTDASGSVQHFDGVLTRMGESASILQTDAGTGVSGVMQRADAFCDGSGLPSRLKLQTSGAIVGSGGHNSIGALQIGEEGTVSAVESRFQNGTITRVSSTGNLTVNLDCTVSLNLGSSDGVAMRYEGLLVGGGRELMLVRSDTGVIVSGEATGQ